MTWTRRPPSRASKFTIGVPSGEDARTPVQLASTWNARSGIEGEKHISWRRFRNDPREVGPSRGRPDGRTSDARNETRLRYEEEVEGIPTRGRGHVRANAANARRTWTWLLLVLRIPPPPSSRRGRVSFVSSLLPTRAAFRERGQVAPSPSTGYDDVRE